MPKVLNECHIYHQRFSYFMQRQQRRSIARKINREVEEWSEGKGEDEKKKESQRRKRKKS